MYNLTLLVFNQGLKFQDSVCNGCDDLTMLCLNMNDIAIFIFKVVGYSWIIHGISKSEAIPLLENSVLDDHGYIYSAYAKSQY